MYGERHAVVEDGKVITDASNRWEPCRRSLVEITEFDWPG